MMDMEYEFWQLYQFKTAVVNNYVLMDEIDGYFSIERRYKKNGYKKNFEIWRLNC